MPLVVATVISVTAAKSSSPKAASAGSRRAAPPSAGTTGKSRCGNDGDKHGPENTCPGCSLNHRCYGAAEAGRCQERERYADRRQCRRRLAHRQAYSDRDEGGAGRNRRDDAHRTDREAAIQSGERETLNCSADHRKREEVGAWELRPSDQNDHRDRGDGEQLGEETDRQRRPEAPTSEPAKEIRASPRNTRPQRQKDS
jgi:hypothetical protein